MFRHVTVPLLRAFAPLFFDKRYLTGRHFTPQGDGWRWVARSLLTQRILRYNRDIPWPVSPQIVVSDPRKIEFHPDDLNNFQGFGTYYQNFAARIVIGQGTYIAPNTGFITANHDPENPARHLPGKDIVLGRECWVGMNATLMPGVTLGDHTVVAAGAVVTKSYPEGWVVLAGVPARPIRHLTRATGPSKGAAS
jgi:hypothetical protein